jgi:hypothetical protein
LGGRAKLLSDATPRGLSVLLALSILSGCVSASLEDAAPKQLPPEDAEAVDGSVANNGSAGSNIDVPGTDTSANTAEGAAAERDTSFVEDGALRNRRFPTFAKMPVGATEQLSAADKQQLESEMAEIRAAFGSGGISEAEYRARLMELEELARTHASEAKKQIEN